MFRIYDGQRLFILTLASLTGLFIPFAASALAYDSKEPIHIFSESTVYNVKSSMNIFEGHVRIDQGATHITADRLTTKADSNHKIQEIIAYGLTQPAHYWSIPNTGEAAIHANANVIKFYPIQGNITLEQHVIVKQGENSFQGELIHYNINDQTITVPASNSGRSVIVYNPDK